MAPRRIVFGCSECFTALTVTNFFLPFSDESRRSSSASLAVSFEMSDLADLLRGLKKGGYS
jgi:hypothetical protein